ncbi:MAG: triose-phosphate isomerase [Candidatus Colwellbacteria bacterium]|nr:triose-phosphate isomerase [Candidatus Colwellbacteria bacterium]
MSKLIVANWKCHPSNEETAKSLFRLSDRDNVVVCPPFVYIPLGREILKKASLGAQDSFWEEGSYTGEVSASQIKSVGARFAIIGHSERRAMGESDLDIKKKVSAAIKEGLTAIVCVGEPSSIKAEGEEATNDFISLQLSAIGEFFGSEKLIIAYEPVWAIGSGNPALPADAASKASFIRSLTGNKTKVLYGGSVSAAGISEFAEREEIDGFLIGGGSVNEEELTKMFDLLEM